jgi:midasin (ATPase involved in ribosome maturation)
MRKALKWTFSVTSFKFLLSFPQLLQQATASMLEARGRQQGMLGRPETAQLLVLVSDGRGINAKGAGVVRRAVRQAREANIFLVFVILDDPKNKVRILLSFTMFVVICLLVS